MFAWGVLGGVALLIARPYLKRLMVGVR